jgi:hypothetical protein
MHGSLREGRWHVKLSHCSYRRILYNHLLVSTDLSHVRLGTRPWAYEGWHGLVYQRIYPKSRFSQDTLTEYAGYEMDGIVLFRTVGIDHSFYRPASPDSSSSGKIISAQQNFDGLHVWDSRRTARRIAERDSRDGRDEVGIQSVHVAPFPHVSRFTRHGLWRWRTFPTPC